jgi:hypothetical protein
MGAVRHRPWYLRAGALIPAMVILVIVPAVLLAADAAGPGRSPAAAWPGRPVVGQRRQPDRARRPTAVQFAGTREDMAARASGPLFQHHAE